MQAKTLAFIGGLLGLLTAAAIFGIMAISFSDVVARSFARPLGGAYEITELLVGVMVFAALPVVTWRGKHVAVGFLQAVYARSPVLKLGVGIFSRGVTAGVCLFLGYHLWALGEQMMGRGAMAVFAGLPLAPFAFFASTMCFLSAAAAVLRPATAIAGEEI